VADVKSVMQRLYDDVFNRGDLAVLDDVVDDSFVEHEEFPGTTNDKAGLVAFVTSLRNAFPDLAFEVVATVAEGDEAWAQIVIRGTQQGEFLGIPASGRRVEVAGIDRLRFRDGKVVEHWGVTDILSLMQQVGAIPS
jgi:steroid delta-isomerase-like uncharacterized protein